MAARLCEKQDLLHFDGTFLFRGDNLNFHLIGVRLNVCLSSGSHDDAADEAF